MLIPLLRAGALAVNGMVGFGLPLLLGTPWPGAVAIAAGLGALSWWGCGRAPRGEIAPPQLRDEAVAVARLLDLPEPRFVRALPGWAGAVVRARGGYGVLLGRDVAPGHVRALLAHELAHVAAGDLFWEPWTDGPLRLLLPVCDLVPPFLIGLAPLLVFGVPLARVTELAADRRASAVIPSYPTILQEVTSMAQHQVSLLYPPMEQRRRVAARASY